MTCKNCGAQLRDNARVCPNCGTFTDDSSGYTLLTSDDRMDDYYSTEPVPERKGRGTLAYVISLLLTVAILFGGSYYYFTHIRPQEKETPPVQFTAGYGIINDTQPVVFATMEKNMKIQYIQGVTLLENKGESPVSLSTDYEYTKNIDDTFRAIFFDMTELQGKNGGSYLMEIKLSFRGDDAVYTYSVPVEVKGEIRESAADAVFDHSKTAGTSEDTTANTAEAQTTAAPETTEKKVSNTAFIYDSYWFTSPKTEGEVRTIRALKFNKDNSFTETTYRKDGTKAWQVSTARGTFESKKNTLRVTLSGKKETFVLGDGKLYEDNDGKAGNELTARRYNSVKNAEDFFGL